MSRLHYASTKDANMLYELKHQISDPVFFLEHDGVKRVFLPSIELEAFKEGGSREVEAVDMGPLAERAAKREGARAGSLALVILEEYGAREEEIAVPTNFPVAVADSIRKTLPRLTAVVDWAPERVQKTSAEVAAIIENFEHTKKAFELVEQILTDSRIDTDMLIYGGEVLTSEFLKREVSKLLLEYDLVSPEGLIISCEKHAVMPHHSGTGPVRPGETIIVDIFPQSTANYYFADMTRTYVKGEPSEKVQKMHAAVEEAQRASLAALKPGVSTKEVYEISAELIREYGFDVGETGYMHSLGHGLGVAVHELPNLSLRSDAVLEPGHVVTIEPGLYYPEWGGVRIEDAVVITEEGHENLTNYPQNWIIL